MRGVVRPGLETGFTALLVAIGGAIAYISWGYGFGTVARPGPGLYPFFVGLAIALFAAILLVGHVRRPPENAPFERGQATTLSLMIATFCLWILAMPILGYVIMTALATFALAKTMKLEGWTKPLAISFGIALFIWLLFDQWLVIDLPRGMFFER